MLAIRKAWWLLWVTAELEVALCLLSPTAATTLQNL